MNLKASLIILICLTLLISACGKNGSTKPKENDRLESSKQVDDQSAEMLNLELGVGYLQRGKKGDIDIALEKFKKAVTINPKFALAHSLLANVYDRKGLFDSAQNHYELSIKYNNGNPDIINNYANFLCQRDKYDKAIEKYLEVVKNSQYSTPAAAYENAGVCSYRANKTVEAEKYFRLALKENKKQPNSLYYMLKINLDEKKYMKARAFLQRLEQVVSPNEEILYEGYKIEKALGNTALSTKYLTTLKNKFPDSELLKQIN